MNIIKLQKNFFNVYDYSYILRSDKNLVICEANDIQIKLFELENLLQSIKFEIRQIDKLQRRHPYHLVTK